MDYAANLRITDSSEACGGTNRMSVYTATGTVTASHVIALQVPTVQTTNLPGNWQYSECLAYVLFPEIFDILQAGSGPLRPIANLAPVESFRIGLYSLKTIPPRTVFHNAQPLVSPRRVWNMAMSAVCNLLLRRVYDVTYGNVPFQGAATWPISPTAEVRLSRQPTAPWRARATQSISVEVSIGYSFIFGKAT